MSRLAGKTALITGGNSGIGFGTARRMVEEGAFVYITGRNQERLDEAISRLGSNARAHRADVTDRAVMGAVVEAIQAERGTLDIVFANAGAAWYNTIDKLTEEQIDNGLALDLKGTIFTVQAALPLIPPGGVIIVNTSITQDMGLPTFGVYAAAKAGLRSLVRTWTDELRDRRIRVNAISPGTTHTEVFEKDMGAEEPPRTSSAWSKRSRPAGSACPRTSGTPSSTSPRMRQASSTAPSSPSTADRSRSTPATTEDSC